MSCSGRSIFMVYHIKKITGLIIGLLSLLNCSSLKNHIRTPMIKNAYYLILGTGVTSLLGFIYWIFAARLFTSDALGFSSALISSLGLIAIFSELGLGIAIIRFLPNFTISEKNDFVNTCLTISCVVGSVMAVGFILGLGVWAPGLLFLHSTPVYGIVFIVFSFFFALQPLVSNVFIATRVNQSLLIINTFISITKIILLVIFFQFFNSFFGLFLSTGLAVTMGILLAFLIFIPRIQDNYKPIPKMKLSVVNTLKGYSLGNYIGRILLLSPPLILPLIIVNVLGPEMNAYFFITWSFIVLLQVIPSSLFNSLFAESTNEGILTRNNIIKSLKLMLVLSVVAIFVIFISADDILCLFGTEYSLNGAMLLRVLSLSIIPWGIIYLYISIERINCRTKNLLIITAASCLCSLLLSYLFMIKLNLIGLGLGYLLGQCAVSGIATRQLYVLLRGSEHCHDPQVRT